MIIDSGLGCAECGGGCRGMGACGSNGLGVDCPAGWHWNGVAGLGALAACIEDTIYGPYGNWTLKHWQEYQVEQQAANTAAQQEQYQLLLQQQQWATNQAAQAAAAAQAQEAAQAAARLEEQQRQQQLATAQQLAQQQATAQANATAEAERLRLAEIARTTCPPGYHWDGLNGLRGLSACVVDAAVAATTIVTPTSIAVPPILIKESITGIPNWWLLAGGLVGLFVFKGGK